MVSGDLGRIGIIKRSKESGTAQRTRYRDVKAVLRNALTDPARERTILADATGTFEQRSNDPSLSNFARDDAAKSLDVLTAFRGIRNQLAGYDYTMAPIRQPHLLISGVKVFVTLDLLIHRSRGDAEEIGGLMFRLTQADDEETDDAAAKRRDMGAYAATLVRMQIAENFAGNRLPAYQLCWSVDVQSGEVHIAPRTFAQRARNIESACLFIAAMWDRV